MFQFRWRIKWISTGVHLTDVSWIPISTRENGATLNFSKFLYYWYSYLFLFLIKFSWIYLHHRVSPGSSTSGTCFSPGAAKVACTVSPCQPKFRNCFDTQYLVRLFLKQSHFDNNFVFVANFRQPIRTLGRHVMHLECVRHQIKYHFSLDP